MNITVILRYEEKYETKEHFYSYCHPRILHKNRVSNWFQKFIILIYL